MNKTIFFVDDDEALVECISVALEVGGYKVVSQMTGRGAFERVKNLHPNLVLLDLWLPGMDGDEIVSQIKGDKITRSIPVILISARRDLKERAQMVKVEDYLPKPFNISQLFEKIKLHTSGF